MSAAPELAISTTDDGPRTTDVPTRIRLRPTAHCRMLALMLLMMIVAAINYQSNAAWGLAMGLGATVALSALHTRRNLALVTATAGVSDPVFAGAPPRIGLNVASIQGSEACDITLGFPEAPGAMVRVGIVPALASTAATIELEARERGTWRLTRLRISSRFPLGLIEASREVPIALDGVVYPHPRGEGAAAPAGEIDASGEGGAQPGADDFLGHRAYREGDPQRHVDWKAHARGLPLLVKRFAGAGGGVLWCDWAEACGDTESRLSQLARWVVDAHRSGSRYGLRLPSAAIDADRGPAHYHACLRLLALQPRADGSAP